MKKYHAMLWAGLVLAIAGATRLILPFSTAIGTLRTSCGNAVAFLDGQDSGASANSSLSVCTNALHLASLEGGLGFLVGIIAFFTGLIVLLVHRRRMRAFGIPRQSANRQAAQHQRSAGEAEYGGARAAESSMANPEVYEQFMRLGRLSRPRTVLSFFGILFAALVAGSVVAISLFSKHTDLSHYIPYILIFDGIVTIMLIIGVFVTITKDPARLMLSEITSQNAMALRAGRRREDPKPGEVVAARTRASDVGDQTPLRRRWDDQR